jgi:cytoskeletal protein CcmA (bactofilin family)
MFFKKNPNRSAKSETLATLIDLTVQIDGQLRFDKSARIDGTIRGNVTGSNAKKGMLIVGPEARIDGDVNCHSVVVLGKVHGTVHASYVEIRSSAQIVGDVHYEVIEVHQGSNINGRLLHQVGHETVETPDVAKIASDAKPIPQLA